MPQAYLQCTPSKSFSPFHQSEVDRLPHRFICELVLHLDHRDSFGHRLYRLRAGTRKNLVDISTMSPAEHIKQPKPRLLFGEKFLDTINLTNQAVLANFLLRRQVDQPITFGIELDFTAVDTGFMKAFIESGYNVLHDRITWLIATPEFSFRCGPNWLKGLPRLAEYHARECVRSYRGITSLACNDVGDPALELIFDLSSPELVCSDIKSAIQSSSNAHLASTSNQDPIGPREHFLHWVSSGDDPPVTKGISEIICRHDHEIVSGNSYDCCSLKRLFQADPHMTIREALGLRP